MKIVINIPDWCYGELNEGMFPVQDAYRLVEWIKEGEIIKETESGVKIGTVKAGTTVEAGGIKLDILDTKYPVSGGKTGVFCLAKDILFGDLFDKDNSNNWSASSLRKYLNREYLYGFNPELANALIPFERDLISDDGWKDYEKCVDTISLISCDEYRTYRDYISDKSDWWWTLTPYSCRASSSYSVRFVDSVGSLSDNNAFSGNIGVAPVFLIDPSLNVEVVEEESEGEE